MDSMEGLDGTDYTSSGTDSWINGILIKWYCKLKIIHQHGTQQMMQHLITGVPRSRISALI